MSVGWSVGRSVGWSVGNAFVRRSTLRTLLAYLALLLDIQSMKQNQLQEVLSTVVLKENENLWKSLRGIVFFIVIIF